MLWQKALRAAVLCCALGAIVVLGSTGSLARQDPDAASDNAARQDDAGPQDEATQDENERRRVVRMVLPWSALEDLTPRQEATIRDIRAEIMNKREALDREERERILAVLTESQKLRVKEIEEQRAQRQREARQRQQERRNQSGDEPGDEPNGDNPEADDSNPDDPSGR